MSSGSQFDAGERNGAALTAERSRSWTFIGAPTSISNRYAHAPLMHEGIVLVNKALMDFVRPGCGERSLAAIVAGSAELRHNPQRWLAARDTLYVIECVAEARDVIVP